MAARIAIVGPGALGRALGETLRAGGAEVAYLGREGAPRPFPEADFGILTTKAYDTAAAAKAFRAWTGGGVPLASLQNGLGNVEAIADALGPALAFGGATTHAARRLPSGEVRHVAKGETTIAPFEPAALERGRAIAAQLTTHGVEARCVEDLPALLFGKLAVSCAVNAVTGVLGVENGAVARDPAARAMAERAAREVWELAARLGIRLPFDPAARAIAVAERTAGNRSSLLQDLDAGRRTEIDYTTGAVVARARALGMRLSENERLYEAVKALEERARAAATA